MNTGKYILQLIAACAACVAFFFVLGWAGDFDYCDQVILNMSQEQYDYVRDTLTKKNGSKPSERQITHWWAEHHKD